MTFAMITPALIVGAFAERMKFAALALFIPLWVTLIYFPIAHMVWYWPGPDAIDAAAKALAAATDDAAKKTAQEALDAVNADAGQIFLWGAIDFAGGTVVHINAGIAGLVGALIIGKRTGYGKELMPPHSLVMTMIGASLLWVGWFGFNVGSNLEANGTAALAMINTFVATCAAALAWMFAEWLIKGKASLLGIVTGAVAGLVAVTPAAGFSGPMGAIILGLVAGLVCLFFCSVIKNMFGYDDSLDVFGVHCVGGIVGALGTGILVNPALGGTGIFDYTTGKIAEYDFAAQMLAQSKAVLTDALVVGYRHPRCYSSSSASSSVCECRSTRSGKASISPSTENAPTTCKFHDSRGGAYTRHRPSPNGGSGRKTGASFVSCSCPGRVQRERSQNADG